MSVTYLLHSLVVTPLFASRAFLATFLTAVFARWGTELPLLGDSTAITGLSAAPAWFTHDLTLGVLALFALIEILAEKNADARRFLLEVDPYVKGSLSLAVNLALFEAGSDLLLNPILGAGIVPADAWAIVPAGLSFWMARRRSAFYRFLADADDGDDLRVQRMLSWAEDGWVIAGFSLAVLLPALAVGLFVLTLAGLAFAQRGVDWMQARENTGCAACAQPLHASAPACNHCGEFQPSPRAVGFFGQAQQADAPDHDLHRVDLLSTRRCPTCATRLPKRAVQQPCPACNDLTFANGDELREYLDRLALRLPKTMAVCFAFGFVPLLGIIPGIIWYRLGLLSGMLRYVPPAVGCTSRIAVRLMNLVLICLQPLPVVGAFTLPALCAANFAFYRRVLLSEAERLDQSR